MQYLVTRCGEHPEYVDRDGRTTNRANDAELMSQAAARRVAKKHGGRVLSERDAFGEDYGESAQ